MSEALIASLNGRIAELTNEKANLKTALRQARDEVKTLKSDNGTLTGQVRDLTADRDRFRGQAEAAPGEQAQKVRDLEAKLAARDFRDAYREAAAKAGVVPKHADTLFKVLELKPGEQPATTETFAEALAAAREAHDWAFDGGQSPGQGDGSSHAGGTPTTAPPPGSGRSASSPPASQVKYTSDEVARPGWQQARPELVEAFAKGNAVRVGD